LYSSQPAVKSTTGGHLSAVTKTKPFDSFHTTARRELLPGAASMLGDQSVVYYPEELSLLGDILDQVLESLPAAMRTPYNRTQIAKKLMACAATGERDRIEGLHCRATKGRKPIAWNGGQQSESEAS
jgi:hypothetical protein